jgi:hypothetical protein
MVTVIKTKEQQKKEKDKAKKLYPGVSNAEQLARLSSGGGLSGPDRLELAQARANQQGAPGVAPIGFNKRTGQLIQSPETIASQQQFEQTRQLETLPQDILQAEEELEPSILQKQFESEGGFEELEGRGERAAEAGATIGLAPAAGIANLITSGIEKITGNKYGRITAAEMAETTFGKALGLTTAAVGAALLITSVGPAVSSWVGIGAAKIGASLGISKGAVIGAGILGAGAVSGFKTSDIVDKVLNRKEASEIQSSVNTIGQRAPTIVGTVRAGGLTQTQGLAEINRIEEDFNIVEHELQQAAILDPRVKQSGQYIDILQDINDQREVLRESRADILESIPQIDPAQISILLEQIQKQNKEERQELINKGYLKETI